MKVWWVARQECTATMDCGEGRVWALAARGAGGALEVTAGQGGGRLTVWRDDTERCEQEKREGAERVVVQHQRLQNLLQDKQWAKAVRLALTLSQPFTALKIIKRLEVEELGAALAPLDPPGVDQLLGYCVKWNSNSRHAAAAQAVLHCILATWDSGELVALPNSATWLPGLLPYTEKHLQRLGRLRRKAQVGSAPPHPTTLHLHLTTPPSRLTSPHLTSAHHISTLPHHTSPHLNSPHHTSPDLWPRWWGTCCTR